MLYFIPAWYKENFWNENEQIWYKRRMSSEFDETIKQITLFHRNVKIPYRILLLGFSPNLRHFLHRQGMYRAPYWSCFDAMLQIRRTKTAVLSYHDIKWPEGVEFIYSPFAVNAYLHGEQYALVDFGEDGNPISINMYRDGEICRKNYYDDRGFVALTVIYENGQEQYRDYLMENGVWKLRMYVQDGHIEVNPGCPFYDITDENGIREERFRQTVYQSMEEVIGEVFYRYLNNIEERDQFFVAAHALHMPLLGRCMIRRKVIITFFGDRYDYSRLPEDAGFIARTHYVIADSMQTETVIRENLDNVTMNIMDISPYDTRMDFGISAQLNVQNILVPIDGIPEEEYRTIITETAGYLRENPLARVHLFTRNAAWGYEDRIRNNLEEILTDAGFDREWVSDDTQEDRKEEKRFYIDVCVDERTISKCINEQRVVLDLRKTTDVYVFVTAISKGVPRISMSRDEYLVHLKNGYVLHDYLQIKEALSYYLDNFENWNAALVACYEIGQKYTTEVLLQSWRKVLGVNE